MIFTETSNNLQLRLQNRPTIGFLTTDMKSHNAQQMWRGVVDVASERDANTLCIVGDYLQGDSELDLRGNILYQMVSQKNVDALVIRGYLSSSVTAVQEQQFYSRFAPLPTVIMGRPLNGIPYVLMDSYMGMYEAVSHLINDHMYRRLAFLRGPNYHDARERYRAFVDALCHYNIPLDTNLVTAPLSGGWQSYDIDDFVDWFFKYAYGNADAIVTASAGLALELMHALRLRGIHIPQDIAVVGFDYGGEWALSPLTTVDGRHYDQARQATSMILDFLAGQSIQSEVILPTRLIVRESCGCRSPKVAHAYAAPTAITARLDIVRPDQIFKKIVQTIDVNRQQAAELLQALFADLTCGTTSFISELEDLLLHVTDIGGSISIWQDFISTVRCEILPYLADRQSLIQAESLWQQARVTIARSMELAQARHAVEIQRHTALVQEISQALITTFDLTELADMLAEALPRLEIPSAYLVLYDSPDQPAYRAQLILAYVDYQRIDLKSAECWFPTTQLIPPHLLPTTHRYHLIVEPLYFQTDQIGFAVFEMGPQAGSVYDMLRGQLSAALKGSELFARNVELYHQARVAQEFAEEANHLKSRFLATVSHELRTPVNLLVGLSEMLLEKQGNRIPRLPEPYRQDFERIHFSAQHLDSLLRDVMDLAQSQVGKLQLAREPVALRQLLNEIASLASQMAHEKDLHWHAEIPASLPLVHGDADRLKQVTFNLVRNAIKFTASGQITLRVESRGSEVFISVEDTGLGIPLDEQMLIFDEFQTSGRTATRGFGGLGLGLAISRYIVEAHGGSIGVESSGEEGSGSKFYFSLPIMQVIESQPSVNIEQEPVILLLTTTVSESQVQQLAHEDYAIHTLNIAGDDPSWFEQVVEKSPQMIVLNLNPDTPQGWQILRRLKQHPATQGIPVLFYAPLEGLNRASVFIMDYLEKPLNTVKLARTLSHYGLSNEANSSKTVLIVDDEPQTLELHVRAVRLQLPTCHIMRAANGHQALELSRIYKPDLVLLDLMMPELDGFGVLSALHDDPDLRNIPVIILTAMSLTSEEIADLNQRVAGILSKGVFKGDEIAAQITAVLERNHHRQSVAQQTVQYIHRNFKKPISRADLAEHASVSERHLDRCFQQDIGLTPITYLNRYRLQQAKILLEDSRQSIANIAAAVGFSSVTQLGRAFRREFGISPSAYQRGEQPQ